MAFEDQSSEDQRPQRVRDGMLSGVYPHRHHPRPMPLREGQSAYYGLTEHHHQIKISIHLMYGKSSNTEESVYDSARSRP
jgi:hypothetical protein